VGYVSQDLWWPSCGLRHLFPYLSGKLGAGQPRRDFRKAWATACKAAGVAGRLRHDLRRRQRGTSSVRVCREV
jgi:hypothetical protein